MLRTTDNEEAKALLNLICAGDEKSYRSFHRAFHRGVYAYLRNQLHNEADAEEIMSDTMYEVWSNACRFRGDSTVKTWIIGIARNKALMRIRSETKGGKLPPHHDIDDLPDQVLFGLVQDEPDVVDTIIQTQVAQGVRKCMARLSAVHSECLHLFFYEGFSLAEIAGVQGVDDNCVKGRLHQARLKIKQCLANLLRALGDTK